MAATTEKTWGIRSLAESDQEIFGLLGEETKRQKDGLCLIASENFTSLATLEALGSVFTNKYAEGYPGRRYYGGTEVCDKVETLCQARALKAFGLSEAEWDVNVQVYSGSAANWVVMDGLLQPHDRVMGLDLASGGHLSHGYRTAVKKLTASGKYFEPLSYRLDPKTGLIDYEEMEQRVEMFRPRLLICGGSAYPRDWDYARFRAVADKVGAYLLCDMAHTSGLVAAKLLNNPFEFSDVVTTTTHKTLRGPRGALVFFRKTLPALSRGVATAEAKPYDLAERINGSVFPGNQGGPHMNAVAAVAVALQEAQTPEFLSYAQSTRDNARILAQELSAKGHLLASGGTDNHIVLLSVAPFGLTGSKVEKAAEVAGLYINKNAVPGDPNPANPSGIRLGSPCLTSRGMGPAEFQQIAEFIHRIILISAELQKTTGKLLKDFVAALPSHPELAEIKASVAILCSRFPLPGVPSSLSS